jgi:hypothetical protein
MRWVMTVPPNTPVTIPHLMGFSDAACAGAYHPHGEHPRRRHSGMVRLGDTFPVLDAISLQYQADARRAVRPVVSVVIPAMNEADNLPQVLSRLPDLVDDLILVDGHSTDETIAVARALRPDIRVVSQTAHGKGNALACGFAMCRGDIIVMLDADGSTDPGEIPLFVDALMDGADFVKGSRYMEGGGSEDLTHVRRLGNSMLTGTVNALFNVQYTDLCYGYMAFWRRCLPLLTVDCTGFEVETQLTLRAARAGLTVAEVPSVERNRISGDSNLRPIHDGLRVLRTIADERFTHDRVAQEAPAWAALTGQLEDAAAGDTGRGAQGGAKAKRSRIPSRGGVGPGPRAGVTDNRGARTAAQSATASTSPPPHDLLVIVPSVEDADWIIERIGESGARVVVMPPAQGTGA